MAITRLTEATLLKGDAKYEVEKSTARRVFYATFDAKPTDYADLVTQFMTAATLALGDPYKTADNRLLKTVSPASLGTTLDYVIDCSYETPANSSGSGNPNPLMRPDEVSISGTSSTRPYFTDNTPSTAKPVTTSAGEPFQKLPERFVGALEIVIKGNRASLSPASWAAYLYPQCAINSDAVTIRGLSLSVGQALMKSIRSSFKYENSVTYHEIEWTIAVAPTWDDVIEDRGYFEKVSGKLKAITADNGVDKVATPYPLDGSGAKKANPTDTPATLTFKPYPKMAFSTFTFTSAA